MMKTNNYTINLYEFSNTPQDVRSTLFRMRKKGFIDRLNWDIDSYKGQDEEADQFDSKGTYYITIENSVAIQGSVRLRPSYLPNLTNQNFSWLTEGVCLNTQKTWEASRFIINSSFKVAKGRGGNVNLIDERTVLLFLSMLNFAISNGINDYEIIINTLMRKILSLSGWNTNILSSGKGSLDEPIHYGLLPCSINSYESVASKHFHYDSYRSLKAYRQ